MQTAALTVSPDVPSWFFLGGSFKSSAKVYHMDRIRRNLEGAHGKPDTRSALCRANTAKKSGFPRYHGAYASAWNWREHRNLHLGQSGAFAAVAIPPPGPPCPHF